MNLARSGGGSNNGSSPTPLAAGGSVPSGAGRTGAATGGPSAEGGSTVVPGVGVSEEGVSASVTPEGSLVSESSDGRSLPSAPSGALPISAKGLVGTRRSRLTAVTAAMDRGPIRRCVRDRRAEPRVARTTDGRRRSTSSHPENPGRSRSATTSSRASESDLPLRPTGGRHCFASCALDALRQRPNSVSVARPTTPPTSNTASSTRQPVLGASARDRDPRREGPDEGTTRFVWSMSSQPAFDPPIFRPSNGDDVRGGPPARRLLSCRHGLPGLIDPKFPRTRHPRPQQLGQSCRPTRPLHLPALSRRTRLIRRLVLRQVLLRR